MARGRHWAALAFVALTFAGMTARATDPPSDERVAIHGQFTWVEQESDGFHAPYTGPNSLSPSQGRETVDATLYLGARLWPGAEAWLNPELDQGFGLDNTLGAAGFPSGEAYKVGRARPYLRLPRAFVRDTINLGPTTDAVEGAANQLAGLRAGDRLVLTVGKFGVGDVFDTSAYAHDPRGDFLNWTAIDAGSFDYAADAWGFTVGASVEWYHGPWTFRAGAFDLSDLPNSPHLAPGGAGFQLIAELERRFAVGDHAGRVLVTGYDSRAHMARLEDALAASTDGRPADLAALRRYRSRTGAHLLVEQEIGGGVTAFSRVGGASGNVEAYDFTDIDRTASLGLSVKGAAWGRSDDTIGLALMANGISAIRQRYLAAGGLGILIGDGALPHPATEHIAEAYYSLAVGHFGALTADVQSIRNPAYNADRGPALVFALRAHAQF